MRFRSLFFASLLCVPFAFLLHTASLGQFSRSSMLRANSISVSDQDRADRRQEAENCRRGGSICNLTGLAFATTSLVLVILSARRKEPAARSITVVFLVLYVLFVFGVVT